MAYGIGGGGGKAPGFTENPQFSLAKPGDLTDLSDPSQVSLLDEMLRELYESHRLLYGVLLDGGIIGSDGAAEASGTGDVVGPSSATDDNLASFNTTTGKLIQDSGYSVSSILASAGATYVMLRREFTEAQLEDVFANPPELVAAPGSGYAVYPIWGHFSMTTSGGYGVTPVLRIQHVGLTSIHLDISTATWGTASFKQGTSGAAAAITSASSVNNVGLRLVFSADPGVAGTLTGNAVLNLAYVKITL